MLDHSTPVHPIRLHGPWHWDWHSAGGTNSTKPQKVTVPGILPADVVQDKPTGQFQFRRRFQRPTGLTADQTVFLVIESLTSPVWMIIRDAADDSLIQKWPTIDHDGCRVDITSCLRDSNVVEICFKSALISRPVGIDGQVRLEIVG